MYREFLRIMDKNNMSEKKEDIKIVINARSDYSIKHEINKDINDPNIYSEVDNYQNNDTPLHKKRPKLSIKKSHIDAINKIISGDPPTPPIVRKKVDISREITSIDELLKLIDDYHVDDTIEYNINMKSLHDIKNNLIELKKISFNK
jgi:hypothetical protein